MRPTPSCAGLILIFVCAGGLATAEERPGMRTEVVEYQHEEQVCEGYVAWDPAVDGRRPGILVCHAWRGQDEFARDRCRALAELGYVAFALDVYGKGVRASSNDEARALSGKYKGDRALMRARAAAALAVLAAHELVDAKRLGVIGYCFGGTTALELARSGADLDAVVSFHGGLSTPDPTDAKNIVGRVLALHGGADASVGRDEVAAFQDEMTAAGVDWQVNVYGGAQHGFTEPGRDRYQEEAATRSWDAMRECFAEVFAPEQAAAQPFDVRGFAFRDLCTCGGVLPGHGRLEWHDLARILQHLENAGFELDAEGNWRFENAHAVVYIEQGGRPVQLRPGMPRTADLGKWILFLWDDREEFQTLQPIWIGHGLPRWPLGAQPDEFGATVPEPWWIGEGYDAFDWTGDPPPGAHAPAGWSELSH